MTLISRVRKILNSWREPHHSLICHAESCFQKVTVSDDRPRSTITSTFNELVRHFEKNQKATPSRVQICMPFRSSGYQSSESCSSTDVDESRHPKSQASQWSIANCTLCTQRNLVNRVLDPPQAIILTVGGNASIMVRECVRPSVRA